MKSSTALVVLGMLWAVTVNAAAAKRGGCSAYGHSCFGGYGKRGGAGLLLAAPLPLPLPQQQQQQQQQLLQREAPAEGMDKNPADVAEAAEPAELEADPGRLPGLPGLRGLHDDAALIVLRQSPVSSRTPLWGRAAAARALHGGDLDDGALGAAAAGAAVGAVHGVDSGEEEDPISSMASRLFLRRWLRTYRRPVAADRSPL